MGAKRYKIVKGTMATAVCSLGAVAIGGCQWLFHFAVARKQWELPEVFAKRLAGSGKPDEFDKRAELEEAELLKLPCERVSIQSEDGLTLKGRFYKGEEGNKDIFLAVHGFRNHGTREFCSISSFYQKTGASYLLIDQRACGESEGEYMTYGAKESEDVRLWAQWLVDQCGRDCRIFLHGISLGSATVLLTAAKELPGQVAGVIADCGYTSAWEEFSHQLTHMGPLPSDWVLNAVNLLCKKKANFDIHDAAPVEAVKQGNLPHLFFHGTADKFVPYYMMQELYDACTAPKKEIPVEGAAHARCYCVAPELYEENILRFMERCELESSR
ncbi:MAG: alpha/beta hydrolase [Clostridia bacterium]|nr:alpha/beta hydrolase [Clostridia bacterium]